VVRTRRKLNWENKLEKNSKDTLICDRFPTGWMSPKMPFEQDKRVRAGRKELTLKIRSADLVGRDGFSSTTDDWQATGAKTKGL
jgi:hypothetical protein